jgi:hypothetical protein
VVFFAGGGGLLLLIQPESIETETIDTRINALDKPFMLVAPLTMDRPGLNCQILKTSGDRGRSRIRMSSVSYTISRGEL